MKQFASFRVSYAIKDEIFLICTKWEKEKKDAYHIIDITVWKVTKYGFFSGPNTEKCGPEKTLTKNV